MVSECNHFSPSPTPSGSITLWVHYGLSPPPPPPDFTRRCVLPLSCNGTHNHTVWKRKEWKTARQPSKKNKVISTPSPASQVVLLGPLALCYGVSWSSILTPHCLNIYTIALGEIIRGFVVQCHQYAADTQLYSSLTVKTGGSVEVLNRSLEMIMG